MDGLNSAACVIAVVQIISQVYEVCRTYYIQVKDARKDIKRLRGEVTVLQDILISVADLADNDETCRRSTLAPLNKSGGHLQQCRADLSALLIKLESRLGHEKMRKFGIRAMKWPCDSEDVDKSILALEQYRDIFALALITDHMLVLGP